MSGITRFGETSGHDCQDWLSRLASTTGFNPAGHLSSVRHRFNPEIDLHF